jgi:photosystem II stability/assembly factor-like uncharacterized protein
VPVGIQFVDRLHGWITVSYGVALGSESLAVLQSLDGGIRWTVTAKSDSPGPNGVLVPGTGIAFNCDKRPAVFGSPSVGLVAVLCAGGRPIVYRTIDGGHRWVPVALPGGDLGGYSDGDPIFITAVDAVMPGTGPPSAGERTQVLLVTHDAGATWTYRALPGWGRVDFESVATGWQLNDDLFETNDGGATWKRAGVPALPFTGSQMQLQVLGKGIAFAFTYNAAFRTSDGATTWQQITPPYLG